MTCLPSSYHLINRPMGFYYPYDAAIKVLSYSKADWNVKLFRFKVEPELDMSNSIQLPAMCPSVVSFWCIFLKQDCDNILLQLDFSWQGVDDLNPWSPGWTESRDSILFLSTERSSGKSWNMFLGVYALNCLCFKMCRKLNHALV